MAIISIIIPVYKVEKYLRMCLDSIINQTFTDWEALLIDDGSPDNSGVICDEYAAKDSRFRVFHKSNGGVSSARNMGIDNARGKWVTFVDSDDYLLPSFLDGLYQPIAEGEVIEFVHCGCQNSIGGKIASINQSYDLFIGEDPALLYKRLRGLAISKLFLLDRINKTPCGGSLRFDENMKIAEDMAFTLDYVINIKRYAFVPEIGYCYRIDNMNSATKSRKTALYNTELHSYKHLYTSIKNYVQKHNLPNTTANIRFSHEARHLQNVCLLLYYNKFSKIERLQHLKMDLTEEDLSLLKTYNSHSIKSIVFSLLATKKYHTFDFLISIIIGIKRLIR